MNSDTKTPPEESTLHRPARRPLNTSQTTNRADSDDELQSAVASSSALVGENVIDSPRHHHRLTLESSLSEWPSSPPVLEETRRRTIVEEDLSVGIMAHGLAWVNQQRNRRRRMYLQNQAQQQLRKLREAQKTEKQQSLMGRTLTENPTFQSLAKAFRGLSDPSETDTPTDPNDSPEDIPFADAATVSESGEGYSVNLPLDEIDVDAAFVPPVRIEAEPDLDHNPYILTKEQRQQIAAHVLPKGIAYCRWKRLYSIARDGDSFDACLRYVAGEQRTLLVIRTARNQVLGGYADMAWEAHSQGRACYYGGPEACLFKVQNGKIRYFKWTGANRYIQLCDVAHKMLAFGGGGDDGAFGLSVGQDFQVGSTGSCATFDNEPLCDQENFEIVDMEIFGFLIGQF